MAEYLIGDVQGCFDSLQKLLKEINFSLDKDKLYFLGDVVNRGNKSLETLRFIVKNSENTSMVLGNHDFHLLACALGSRSPNKKDTFNDVLDAKDRNDLIDFLLQQPLAINLKNSILVHAGVPPTWDIDTTISQSNLVCSYLQGESVGSFIDSMYDNNPTYWSDKHSEVDSCRYTINALMRMRFCTKLGELEFKHKMIFDENPTGYKAWFAHKDRVLKDIDIYFGHWSTLRDVSINHVYPMDDGCIWGGKLSTIRLEDNKIFSVKC